MSARGINGPHGSYESYRSYETYGTYGTHGTSSNPQTQLGLGGCQPDGQPGTIETAAIALSPTAAAGLPQKNSPDSSPNSAGSASERP